MSDINNSNAENPGIAILTNYWKNSQGGGLKTYLIGLTGGLEKKGIKPSIIFREGEDPENYKINGSKYIFPIKSLFILRRIRPKVIHTQGSWFCMLSGYLWKRLTGARLICTIHTVTDNPTFMEKIVMRFLLTRCDAVTFVSKHLEQHTKQVYEIENRVCYITHAGVSSKSVTLEEVRDFKAKFGIKEGKTLLLGQALTAHRVKVEGVKLLIISLKKLKQSNPNTLLLLTREGPYVPELKAFVKEQGVSPYVIFTGDLDDPFIALKACDILTHITLDDAFPIAILEAMSMGIPIIASAVGGIPEIINGENGQLVKNDPDEIDRAIEYLIKNRDIAMAMGKKAQHDAIKYGWDETVNVFISLYMPGTHDLPSGTSCHPD